MLWTLKAPVFRDELFETRWGHGNPPSARCAIKTRWKGRFGKITHRELADEGVPHDLGHWERSMIQ